MLAVSGGSIPPILSELVALANAATTSAPSINIDFSNWKFLFADERCVPLDHSDSNFKLWKNEIFDKIPLFNIETNVLEIQEAGSAELCARNYYSRVAPFLGLDKSVLLSDTFIDLSILGMGPDGHTASLFPEHLLVTSSCVENVPNATTDSDFGDNATNVLSYLEDSPKQPPCRITFTLHALNMSRQVSSVRCMYIYIKGINVFIFI